VGRTCRVSFVDEHGTQHTAEVTADSLYEAALFGVKAISETWAEQPGMATPISVSIVPVVHQVTLRQIKTWLERGSGTPREMAQRFRLREMMPE
jgi:hypothetical protein